MFKNLSIRWRLTILSALLLMICCIGLTIVLNYSAFQLADTIDAALPLEPAQQIPINENNELPQVAASTIPLENLQQAKRGFSDQSILYMLVIILGGSALTYYISGKALKPLNDLNEQIKKLSVYTLSETLAIPPTKDEIAELTQSFNEMTDKLDNAFMLQKNFSTSAAHELRTPLSVLQTKVDVFRKKTIHTNDEYDQLISVFEKQINRLRTLVSNLLDLQNMGDEYEKSNICLTDVFEDIIVELSDVAKQKNVTLMLDTADINIIGNVDLLYRAFYNLIENAIKYNVSGGSVHIEVNELSKDKTQILIKDTGIGIPKEMRKHLFEPFYRVDKSRSRELGGVGLGLSIVESIIKKHCGSIRILDNKETCFQIVL